MSVLDEYDPFSVEFEQSHNIPSFTQEQPTKRRRSRFSDAQPDPSVENICQNSHFTSTTIPNYTEATTLNSYNHVSIEDSTQYDDGAQYSGGGDVVTEDTSASFNNLNKELWDVIWVYVRRYLKPYLKRGNISSTEDCRRLGKKLTQKIYEKELSRGKDKITSSGERRIEKYISDYFERHGYYSSSVNNNNDNTNNNNEEVIEEDVEQQENNG